MSNDDSKAIYFISVASTLSDHYPLLANIALHTDDTKEDTFGNISIVVYTENAETNRD
jgi:hypothetical protein